jgi:CTP synthase
MTRKTNHKFIFVIGGVMSGVGKGITTSSIGKVLQSKGFVVNLVKIDPYLNVDAGTMNPTEHGEVFVLRSGLETDQDMGNYERFLGKDLGDENYMTSGMVYRDVIERERNLKYDGKCVEAIPHIRDEIISRIKKSARAQKAEISVIEIGGTVGDYQNIMFIEAARVMHAHNPEDVLFVMVSFLPIPSKLGEMKTKPTQNAVRQLNSYGVQPDIIIGRSTEPLDKKRKEKIAIQCNIKPKHVVSAPDIESVYDAPLDLEKGKVGDVILDLLEVRTKRKAANLTTWKTFALKAKRSRKQLDIAVVGKYFDTGNFVLSDAYISVIEAIKYSAYSKGVKPTIHWVNSKDFESGKRKISELQEYDGIIVPGGFGETGIEGKLAVIKYARTKKIPYLGLCYGMQLMTIEYARSVLRLRSANTHEINPEAKHLIVDIMPEQKELLKDKHYGGTMRLGVYPAKIKEGTLAYSLYKEKKVEERHRHRYEINPDYIERLENKGLVFSGKSPDGRLMEIAELPKKEHPFFLGTQFHPEFHARPLSPHPLFSGFIKAALKHRETK